MSFKNMDTPTRLVIFNFGQQTMTTIKTKKRHYCLYINTQIVMSFCEIDKGLACTCTFNDVEFVKIGQDFILAAK